MHDSKSDTTPILISLGFERKTPSQRHPSGLLIVGPFFPMKRPASFTSLPLGIPARDDGRSPRLVRPGPVLMFTVYLWTRRRGNTLLPLLNGRFCIYACVPAVAMSTISVRFIRARWENEDDGLKIPLLVFSQTRSCARNHCWPDFNLVK